jgi:hypothetical protein
MKRAVAAGAVALAASVGIAAMADGQSGGAPESGTFTYEVVSKFSAKASPTSNPGVNPARPRDPDRQNPADINALTARIFVNGKAAGRSHIVLTWTYLGRGRRQRGGGLIAEVVEDFGRGDTLVYEGVQTNNPGVDPLAVVGGTGKYAGADGTVAFEQISFKEKARTLRERATVTFTP